MVAPNQCVSDISVGGRRVLDSTWDGLVGGGVSFMTSWLVCVLIAPSKLPTMERASGILLYLIVAGSKCWNSKIELRSSFIERLQQFKMAAQHQTPWNGHV